MGLTTSIALLTTEGRYLWTDAFAVCNFLTLFQQTNDRKYLTLAKRQVETVQNILGKTRDLSSRLPGATDSEPLKGGLRIGKHDDEDDPSGDGDGQYFHYLTRWMFALNRMTTVSGEGWYNDQGISLAKAITPKFMINWESARPRMYWKMSIDLGRPLVNIEGASDPFDGYITYRLLQRTAGNENVLCDEIKAFKKIVDSKTDRYSSSDALDLGMTMWQLHWIEAEEDWARRMLGRAVTSLDALRDSGYFDSKSIRRRLAFREFGTALGCISVLGLGHDDLSLTNTHDAILSTWEDAGFVPVASTNLAGKLVELMPITAVMYASALIPGCMHKARERNDA